MIAMILITTLSVGIAVNAWIVNRQLNEKAVKFRMIRQYYPVAARWADKTIKIGKWPLKTLNGWKRNKRL